ncbi:MAG: hypothetical protein MUC96_14455 [Myxococcaceae bacterium]|jgi:hypothetical protein|nr:hypothetical protein [Myxococcaceae bacterium]
MFLALLGLVAAASPQSPATFARLEFYDEASAAGVADELLAEHGWRTLEFPSPGVVVTTDAGEVERFTFTAQPRDGGFLLVAKAADGSIRTRFWKWVDGDRAMTDLWGGELRTASRRRPSPQERRDAYGESLAAQSLSGSFSAKTGLVFSMNADGGVRWGGGTRGTFFRCRTECSTSAATHLCLRVGASQEYLFESGDGGVTARPVRSYALCSAIDFVSHAREFVGGESLVWKPPER